MFEKNFYILQNDNRSGFIAVPQGCNWWAFGFDVFYLIYKKLYIFALFIFGIRIGVEYLFSLLEEHIDFTELLLSADAINIYSVLHSKEIKQAIWYAIVYLMIHFVVSLFVLFYTNKLILKQYLKKNFKIVNTVKARNEKIAVLTYHNWLLEKKLQLNQEKKKC